MFGRNRTATIDGPLTHEKLRSWLIAELARMFKIDQAQVDTAKPFQAYGLDSRAAVQVSGLWRRSWSVGSRQESSSTTRRSTSSRITSWVNCSSRATEPQEMRHDEVRHPHRS